MAKNTCGCAVGYYTCNKCNTLIEPEEAILYEPTNSNLSWVLCPKCYKAMKLKEDSVQRKSSKRKIISCRKKAVRGDG